MRMRASLSADWRAAGRDGAGPPPRRTLRAWRGWGRGCQLVRGFEPEASSGSLPRPAHPVADQYPRPKILLPKMMNADMDDLSARVDAVKEENLKLKSENQVLGQYIENLMSASSVFQTTDTKSKRK
uniref:Short coiled-coil protein n=1 Tax=Rousettus aegyptiacus TaxID=9407 RepID=A0A7J8BV92_ROUAE|nr:short coiled-coil protein [Rousettus aegyptiacus]